MPKLVLYKNFESAMDCKAVISLENLGTEVSQVDCEMISERIKMARRTGNLFETEASTWQE